MEIAILDTKLNNTLKNARAFVVDCSTAYDIAVGCTRDIKGIQKDINDTFDPIILKAHEAHKEALAQKKKHSEPLLQAEAIMKQKLVKWDSDERKRIALETERVQAENRKKLDEAIKSKEEKALAEAENMSNKDMADMVLETAIEDPLVVDGLKDPPKQEKVEGIRYKTTHKFEIIEEKAIKFEFMKPDEVKIGQLVRSMGKNAESIVGGIKVIEEKVADVRRF